MAPPNRGTSRTSTSYDELPYDDHVFAYAQPANLATVAALHGLDRRRWIAAACWNRLRRRGQLLPMATPARRPSSSAWICRRGRSPPARKRSPRLGLTNVALNARNILDPTDDLGHVRLHHLPRRLFVGAAAGRRTHPATSSADTSPPAASPTSVTTPIPAGTCGAWPATAWLSRRRRRRRPGRPGRPGAGPSSISSSTPCRRRTRPMPAIFRRETERICARRGLATSITSTSKRTTGRSISTSSPPTPPERVAIPGRGVAAAVARQIKPGVIETLAGIGRRPIRLEQYLDFLRCRVFRRSLLCHAAARPDRVHAQSGSPSLR